MVARDVIFLVMRWLTMVIDMTTNAIIQKDRIVSGHLVGKGKAFPFFERSTGLKSSLHYETAGLNTIMTVLCRPKSFSMSLFRVLVTMTVLILNQGTGPYTLAWQPHTSKSSIWKKTIDYYGKDSENKAIFFVGTEPSLSLSSSQVSSSRRSFLVQAAATAATITLTVSPWFLYPDPACAKCKDLESCREIGEQKEAANLAANPIVRLGGGLQYKVLSQGLGDAMISADTTDTVKIAYSISQASGRYMYSQGFGYNKIDAGNGKQMSDLGLDGLTIHLQDPQAKEVPVGIQKAIVGMKRGEKRRIEVPPALGFETSDWNPKPTTFRGERQIIAYQNVLYGRGDQQPPFPAPTIWDVEILSFR